MAIYLVIPGFYQGGDELMRFVAATTPEAALEYTRVDTGDFPITFHPVGAGPRSNQNDDLWRVYEVREPQGVLKHLGVIAWDDLPQTMWRSDDVKPCGDLTMSKHRVHLYPAVRVVFDGIEAASHAEAIRKAEDLFAETHHDFRGGEYAEEVVGALVDEEGDTEYQNSRMYDFTVPPEPSFSWRRLFNSEASNVMSLVAIACFVGMLAIWFQILSVYPAAKLLGRFPG